MDDDDDNNVDDDNGYDSARQLKFSMSNSF